MLKFDMLKELELIVKHVQKNLKTAQDRQRIHANLKRTPKEFQVGEHVFVNIKPRKSSFKLGSCAKLAPGIVDHSKYWQELDQWHIN